jgi:hypothetical protein
MWVESSVVVPEVYYVRGWVWWLRVRACVRGDVRDVDVSRRAEL